MNPRHLLLHQLLQPRHQNLTLLPHLQTRTTHSLIVMKICKLQQLCSGNGIPSPPHPCTELAAQHVEHQRVLQLLLVEVTGNQHLAVKKARHTHHQDTLPRSVQTEGGVEGANAVPPAGLPSANAEQVCPSPQSG